MNTGTAQVRLLLALRLIEADQVGLVAGLAGHVFAPEDDDVQVLVGEPVAGVCWVGCVSMFV